MPSNAPRSLPFDPFKIEREADQTILTLYYPKLPCNTDFETFRKTDPQWKRIVEFYNRRGVGTGVAGDSRLTKERFVFNSWPRSPNGPIMRATPPGRVTSNGCPLWGATLYDFYRVYREASLLSLSTVSTGSKLAAWVKETGELVARGQLQQVFNEDEPYRMNVFDIGQYIEVLENQVWKGKVGKPMEIDRADTQPLFPPPAYPSPWPLRPFSAPLARLQKKLPHSSLPRKLVVHDPWNVLVVTDPELEELDPETCKWGTKPDVIRTYNLKLAEGVCETGTEDTGNQPSDALDCPVAHLYITPKRRIGSGHHSFIYQVELELPREMLVQPKVCYECLKQEQKHVVDELIEEEGLPEVLEDEPPETLYQYIIPLDAPVNDLTMQQNYSLMFKNGRPFVESDRKDVMFRFMKLVRQQTSPPYCEHLDRGIPAPPSQRVSVVAKLSLPDDDYEHHSRHLRNEAAQYQDFPDHMFEHWNGYNVIPPMHDPTPVGAVVPQFYGFYVPDKDNKPITDGEYMSPILLLEHCGVQVHPARLTVDERQECFSLLRRLHIAGYVHHSVYQRNVLMQHGPLQESPFKRSKLHPRFRLIDFGRSFKCTASNASMEQGSEEMRAKEVLRLHL